MSEMNTLPKYLSVTLDDPLRSPEPTVLSFSGQTQSRDPNTFQYHGEHKTPLEAYLQLAKNVYAASIPDGLPAWICLRTWTGGVEAGQQGTQPALDELVTKALSDVTHCALAPDALASLALHLREAFLSGLRVGRQAAIKHQAVMSELIKATAPAPASASSALPMSDRWGCL